MPSHLTPAQHAHRLAKFVREIIHNGKHPEQAAGEAGFTYEEGYALLQAPRVKEALASAAANRLLSEMLPSALGVVDSILKDDKVAASVRGKLAVAIIDRAGLGKIGEDPSGNARKSLQEMSVAELSAMIEKLERAEDARASLIDVTPVTPGSPKAPEIT